ncbi:MAG: metallophosphoesterase [Clostridia bacterium]|nr:metallophosphoesterase [Clostridia bacterium]
MILVQFGDLHLDAVLSGFSGDKSRELRRQARQLLESVVELGEKSRADLILCTGDLFDSEAPYLDSVLGAAEALGKTEIPVFIAPGNHDPFSPASPYSAVDWPRNVHVFSSAAAETVELPFCRVTGWANTEKRQSFRPLKNFVCGGGTLPEILLFHGEIAEDSPYFHATPEEIAATKADYLALGHVHAGFQKTFGSTLAVMNGGVQSTKLGETGDKGAVLANVDSGEAKAALVNLPGNRSFSAELLDTGEKELLAAIRKIPNVEPGRAVVSIVLRGEKQSSLKNIYEKTSDFLKIKIDDRRRETAKVPTGKSLAALFARRAAETGLDGLALKFGLAALENREQPENN